MHSGEYAAKAILKTPVLVQRLDVRCHTAHPSVTFPYILKGKIVFPREKIEGEGAK
jgi:hypothetical protein